MTNDVLRPHSCQMAEPSLGRSACLASNRHTFNCIRQSLRFLKRGGWRADLCYFLPLLAFHMLWGHTSQRRRNLIQSICTVPGSTPWRRKWQPTPVFLPGKSHGQRSLAGYSPWGPKRVRLDLVTKNNKKFWAASYWVTPFQTSNIIAIAIYI